MEEGFRSKAEGTGSITWEAWCDKARELSAVPLSLAAIMNLILTPALLILARNESEQGNNFGLLG
ncbi:MAG: hypothetical protein AAF293_00185 [Pseudomonadota bacterium]